MLKDNSIMKAANRISRSSDEVRRPNCAPKIVPIAPGIAKQYSFPYFYMSSLFVMYHIYQCITPTAKVLLLMHRHSTDIESISTGK